MVQSADFWEGNHVTFGDGLHSSWRGRVFAKGEMRSRPVIVGEISGQSLSEVPLAEYDHMVQTLPPN